MPVPAHVGVELTDILVIELGNLQLDEGMAFENSVVENQVDEVVAVADQDAFSPSLKTETVPQFEQESLQLVEQLVFQRRLAHDLLRLEAQELENIRVADWKGGRRVGFRMRAGSQHVLPRGQCTAFEIEARDLALELPHRPVAAHAFALVEGALGRVCDLNELCQVAERQGLDDLPGRQGLWSRCLHDRCDRRGGEFGRQRLHNLRVGEVELPVAVQLAAVAPSQASLLQRRRQFIHQALPVLGAVHAGALVALDVAADQPVAQGERPVDGPRRRDSPSRDEQLQWRLRDGRRYLRPLLTRNEAGCGARRRASPARCCR